MASRRPRTDKDVDYSATLPVRQPSTIIGETVRQLRIAIMTGRLLPGQKLVEADLCRDFGVSRASLRETLRLTQAEQLIEITPHRGPSVAKLDRRDVEDIHDIWSLLTGEAVFRFTNRAGSEDVEHLEGSIARLRDAVHRKDVLGQLAGINSFFGYVLERCDSSALIRTVSTLVSRVNFLRAQALHHPDLGIVAIGDLSRILDEIALGHAEAARTAARTHIATACTAAKKATLAPHRTLVPFRRTDAESLVRPSIPV